MTERSRRNFIKTTSMGVLASLTIPQIVSSALAGNIKSNRLSLKDNDVILFQGDSITDAGRSRTLSANNGLGSGYPYLAGASLLYKNPTKNLQIFNTGISGNKVYQLADRWEADSLSLKPNILSILVGVNDYWHTLGGSYKGTLQTYKDDYKKLLDLTLQKLPDVKLIIGEPFAIPGVKAVNEKWFPAFSGYQQAAYDLAKTYNAVFIPYQKVFNEAIRSAPGAYWTKDGVHPSIAGTALMAQSWMETVKS
jgi:lysophospholipase L1-like esterase